MLEEIKIIKSKKNDLKNFFYKPNKKNFQRSKKNHQKKMNPTNLDQSVNRASNQTQQAQGTYNNTRMEIAPSVQDKNIEDSDQNKGKGRKERAGLV